MDQLTPPHPSRHDATNTSHTTAYTSGLYQRSKQRSLTSRLIGHIALVLVIGSHVLLCSGCSTAPRQLGVDQEKKATELLAKSSALAQQILQLGKDELNAVPQVREDVERSNSLIAELQKTRQLLEEMIEHEESQGKDTSQLSQQHERVKKLLEYAQQAQKQAQKQVREQEERCEAIANLMHKYAPGPS